MKNELKFLDDFKALLQNYEVPEAAKDLLRKVNLVLLASPSGVGRNTIIDRLMKTGDYHFIVSDTTRYPRVNNGVEEIDGGAYWFISETQFLDGLKNGKYLEASVIHDQQVSGISLKELDRAVSEHKAAITDIEVQGVNAIISVKPDTHAIFLLPPSFEEWMRRLTGRGSMSDVEKARRLNSAIDEYQYAIDNSTSLVFLVSDSLDGAVRGINKIIQGSDLDESIQISAKKLAGELLEKTKRELQKT